MVTRTFYESAEHARVRVGARSWNRPSTGRRRSRRVPSTTRTGLIPRPVDAVGRGSEPKKEGSCRSVSSAPEVWQTH
jgi:hypothetical protein